MSLPRRNLPPIITIVLTLGILILRDNSANSDEQSDQIARVDEKIGTSDGRMSSRGDSKDATSGNSQVNPLRAIHLEQLDQTIKRPLFSLTRRPPPVIKQKKRKIKPKPKNRPNPKDLSLIGVVTGNGKSIALLRQNSNGIISRVKEGDVVRNWRVQKVTPTTVTITQDSTTVPLTLFPK